MDIPEKYLKLKNEGEDSQGIAMSLIIDGYGKLRVIAVLRGLFGLSLVAANEVYEITSKKIK